MNSKLLLIALTTTVFALGAKAQDKTTFGVRAGINFQNLNGEDHNGNDFEGKIKACVHLGLNAEIPIAPDFYIQPGVLFATKGAKNTIYRKVNYKLSYVEIPINLLFKPELGDGKMLLGFGPYIGIAVGGSVKNANGNSTDYVFASDAKAAETGYTLRRVDFGGNFLAGYELSNKLSFQINAQLGMRNLMPKVEGHKTDGKLKNTGFGVSVGYRFN